MCTILVRMQAGELDTLEEMRRKAWDFNTLERSLADEKVDVLATLDAGRHLLQGVRCLELQADVTACTDAWMTVNNDTNTQLCRSGPTRSLLVVHFFKIRVYLTWW